MLFTNLCIAQSKADRKSFIRDAKIEDLIINIYQNDEYAGTVEVKKTGLTKSFIYQVDIDFANLKSVNDVVTLEDFNFDNEKEIVISAHMNGIYLYDKNSGKPKNLFNDQHGYGRPEETMVRNYIHLARGSYNKSDEEKTITISGSCGALCGSELTYKGDGAGNLILIRNCEWNEM